MWGVLSSIKEAIYEPIGMWFPINIIKAGTSEYAQGVEIPTSYVAQEPDQEVKSFYLRPLGEFSVIYLDARYEKVRHGGHIKKHGCSLGCWR